jgi:branched-subunit amino acid transport protein
MMVAMVIAGMMLVTYVPRLLPLIIKREGEPPAWLERTLRLLPFTAIGALLIPDGFLAVNGRPGISALGLLLAAAAMWLTRQPFLAVVIAVAGAALANAFV